MKKLLILFLFSGPLLLNAQVVKQLKKTIELKMPKTADDEMPGTRGAAVVWHPVQKKYYAAFAGNMGFPMAVFDIAGKRLSDEDQTTLIDVRGLWYNEKKKKICGNAYSEFGWFQYTLDTKGMIDGNEVYIEGKNQPTEQSIGVYNAKKDMVYFLSGKTIAVYNSEGMQEEDSTITLYLGYSKKEDVPQEYDAAAEAETDYNYNAFIYTGIPKAEFGLLNASAKQVELYNRKTGLLTQKLKLPEAAATETSFNFSYTNGTYWIFSMEKRTWTGYK